MVRIEKSIEIQAPPEKVWEMLAFDRMPEWMYWKSAAFISEVRAPEDKYRVGASAHVTEAHAKYDLEITESLENQKIMYSSKGIAGGISHLTLTYTLKPAEGGTDVTYACACWGWGPICSICGLFGDKLFGVEPSLNNLKSIPEK